MKTDDNLNYYLEAGDKITVPSLKNDVLQKGFYVRERHEFPMASQDGGWDTTYKRDNWRGTAWHKVENEMPGWVGRTYWGFMQFAAKNHKNSNVYDFLVHELIIVEK